MKDLRGATSRRSTTLEHQADALSRAAIAAPVPGVEPTRSRSSSGATSTTTRERDRRRRGRGRGHRADVPQGDLTPRWRTPGRARVRGRDGTDVCRRTVARRSTIRVMSRTRPLPLPRSVTFLALAAGLVLCATAPCGRGHRAPAGCPVLHRVPGHQRLEPARGLRCPVRARLGAPEALHRARCVPASRLRLVQRLRHPLEPRLVIHATEQGHVPVAGRVRPGRATPSPSNPKVEGGSDRHMLMVDRSSCKLYELFAARKLQRRLARRVGRGLGPGLEPPAALRLDERRRSRAAHPARARALGRGRGRGHPPRAPVHGAADPDQLRLSGPPRGKRSSSSALPPMGLRVRLKASVDISRFPRQARVSSPRSSATA